MVEKHSRIIGINTLFMIPNKVGGTEYHLRSFLKTLEQEDELNSYVIFCNNENYHTFSFISPRWKKVHCKVSGTQRIARLLYEQCVLPFVVQKHKCSLIHSYGYFGPIFTPVPHIVTVHDANWKDHPEDTSFIKQLLLTILCESCLKRATHIITDSQFSANRLLYHFPEIIQKLSIVWPGLEEGFLVQLAEKRKSLFSKHKYVLCVSALYPHKRVKYLLKLWQSVLENHIDTKLILIGNNGSDLEKVEDHVKRIPRIVFKKKVSFRTLINLYKHAQAFIFPSVYEGFGYPVYEAVAAGLPSVVGKIDLYHPSIKKNLTQLTFNSKQDIAILNKLLKGNRRHFTPLSPLNYKTSVQDLLKIYQNLV